MAQIIVSSGMTKKFYNVNDDDYMYVSSGGTANYTTVNYGGVMYVSNGGMANSTTVKYGGEFRIFSGGTANYTTVSSGYMFVFSGGTANNTELRTVNVVIGGVSNTRVKGIMSVDGGVANTIMLYDNSGLTVVGGGTANSATVNGLGSMLVTLGGTANYTTVNSGGELSVFRGGTANNTTVSSGGVMYVSNGGVVNDTTVIACKIDVSSGGTANDTSIETDGELYVRSGGRLTGQMTFMSNTLVSAFDGAVFDFDISRLAPGAGARINNLSIIQGVPLYTLTVDGTQSMGVYSLADGAAGFNSTISVMNTAGDELGALTVGQKVAIGDLAYKLNLADGALSVEVVSSDTPDLDWTFFTGDFNGDLFDTLAVQSGNTVSVFMNGEPWGLGVTLEDGWEIAGVGDFSGDGLDDFLRVNEEGYVVGEMSNGNGTFSPQVLNFKGDGWDILGIGDFNGNGTDDVLIANPTGASETVGLLGYWESGVTWTLINGYSAEWECVATGDFNGDGKCDMLWRNSFEGEDGLIYNAYCTWIVDPSDGLSDWRMVSVANPGEWVFLCSGDFDGDKMNDIAMINDVGVVGIWGVENGWLSSWSILSAVTPEWTLAGVADFNADGTDDIAWANTDTGLTGYWQINDMQLTTWANIANLA